MTSKRMTSDRNEPLSSSEAERLGAWIGSELGTGPGPEAIAAQRLRLARSAPVVAMGNPRAKWWALSGGVVAAAAVVGGIVVVGKLQNTATSGNARRPGISAEPLAAQRELEHPQKSHDEPQRIMAFTWRVASGATASGQTSSGGTPSDGSGANPTPAQKALVSNQALVQDQWLEARTEPVLVELADGASPALGQLEFGLGARVRVTQVNAAELDVELERGIAEAALGAGAARVVLAAGPYLVSTRSGSPASDGVTTAPQAAVPQPAVPQPAVAYGVQWAPKAGALRVEVTRGEVEVTLPSSNERHLVAAGKSLNLVVPDADSRDGHDVHASDVHKVHPRSSQRSLESHSGKPDLAVTDSTVSPNANVEPPSSRSSEVIPGPTATTPAVSGELSEWRKFAENGQYSDAVKAAERVGFANLEQGASASDLLLLADAARLGGAPQRARSLLTSLRSRYPGHTNSAVAAFTLGRMAQEQEHDDRRAIQWYRTYLKEEPGGRMAEGARARLLKATLRVGSEAERDQAAHDYLANHPTGSSAAVARSVLSK